MLDKIKKMLGQITPGPWYYSYEHDDIGPVNDNNGDFSICRKIQFYDNGIFIAASPEMLQWAVQEIERLQRELNHSQNNIKMAVSSIDHKNTEIERLRAALEWYANEDIYTDGEIGFHDKSTAEYDRGHRASEALKGSP